MEGGVHKASKEEFTQLFRVVFQRPYIMALAFSAGIGGLLFGYDTGVISGALLYIRDDFDEVDKKTWLQEMIVSTAIAGAIVGAAIGGWLSDKFGRKKAILLADFLFFIGSIVMAFAPHPYVIIIGRVFVGLGVGMASMTAPLYISESSPAEIRGALISTNGLLITGGAFLSYLINLAFSNVKGNWRWMLGVAGVPPFIQFILMLILPESPRWLYRQNRIEEAKAILHKIYPAQEVDEQLISLRASVDAELAEKGPAGFVANIKGAFTNVVVRRGLYAGVTCQVVQQFCGINTVMYYSPTIVQLAGFASNQTALLLSLITSGLNAVGSIVSMVFVDKYGRRKLMLLSCTGMIIFLGALSVVLFEVNVHAPDVSYAQSTHFGKNSTCPALMETSSWTCVKCLKVENDGCAYCSNGDNRYQPGACIINDSPQKDACQGEKRDYFTKGCPTRFGIFAVLLLGLYIISYAPGMGTAPWIVNSEIYPLRYRGTGGGIAAVSNWTCNLIVSQTFLSLTKALTTGGAFLLFGGFTLVGMIAIFFLVPETKGLEFEEIEQMLQKGFRPSLFSKGGGDEKVKGKA